MALYAFDGTWNSDDDKPEEETNVVRFGELYVGNNSEYVAGVGTRFGHLGHVLGGLLGAGGHSRIDELYEELCENWSQGDRLIDIIGFSRGAALAVHFANKLCEDGVKLTDGTKEDVRIRFLGLWDVVGSFGLSFDTIVNFQEINLGWHIDTVARCVDHCSHAMSLDERRETFAVTRLDPKNEHDFIHEVWFRGVHSDIGGGNRNEARSNIALQWMVEQGRACGLQFNESKAKLPRYSNTDRFAPVSENQDVKVDPRRPVGDDDEIHPSALPIELAVGDGHEAEVLAQSKYNWTGVRLKKGATYRITVPDGAIWKDGGMSCGPGGWKTDELPWYQEGVVHLMERHRRLPDADWFALVAALNDEDDNLFLVGDGTKPLTAAKDADLYLFANDLSSKYGNNKGSLMVTISRIS
jgi:hypothetical protein